MCACVRVWCFFFVCVDFVFRKRDANASMNFVLRLWLQSKSTTGSNDVRVDVDANVNAGNDIPEPIVYKAGRCDSSDAASDSDSGRGSQPNVV